MDRPSIKPVEETINIIQESTSIVEENTRDIPRPAVVNG